MGTTAKQQSRFLEDKGKKPKHVRSRAANVLDDERCILCTRCIRFTTKLRATKARHREPRQSQHPHGLSRQAFDNNYSLNTVDICPVGALTSKDFRFKMRVWFLKETKRICTSCATGCNTWWVRAKKSNVPLRAARKRGVNYAGCAITAG